ncbi:LPXTG cell wall anchor domain-containing protein [Streptomyces sp. NBC_00536]|uniref:LPXTG cell wall anchor domain-containing protein n=1 Tax=Streptomyces sp. NBC_00536 TaxID=2975769 RepID=UPI002E812029|nr:LPXTG cell wall anchor domain-containing protein [Streptomyces sp. NBC_00536]WUC82572.1 LPXTG cell wall anchor domain-containing protein [Streptomyces sp. NBC_00536]
MTLVAPQFRTRGAARPATVLAAVLVAAGMALVPWIAVLSNTLPHTAEVANWSTAWIGLDVMLAAALSGTGLLLKRGDARAGALAAATAALLVLDAWFDVTTSAAGDARMTAVVLAVCAELPLAALCASVAARRPAATRTA